MSRFYLRFDQITSKRLRLRVPIQSRVTSLTYDYLLYSTNISEVGLCGWIDDSTSLMATRVSRIGRCVLGYITFMIVHIKYRIRITSVCV